MRTIKSLRLKTSGIGFALVAVLAVPTAVLAADSYPTKPVRLVVPYTPGGGTDISGRLVAARLSDRLGKQVVVDNRGGAGGIIGTGLVAKADPDGYTLLIVAAGHTIQPALQKLPYDPVKSFTPIGKLGIGPMVLVVHPSVPATSVKELIALAKQKPNQLIFGDSGRGDAQHLAAELFKMMANIEFTTVHFKGTGPALIDLLGGHSQAQIGSMLSAIPHIKSGLLRALGTAGVKRSAILPDVPTVAEAGVPGFTASSWYAVFGPAGLPKPIVNRLNNELKAIMASDEVKNQFLKSGFEADYLGPTEFVAFLGEDLARWASVVKKAKIKVE